MKLFLFCRLSLLGSLFAVSAVSAFTTTGAPPTKQSALVRPPPAFTTRPTTTNTYYDQLQQSPKQQRRAQHVRLFMGWGPDPVWSSATVVSTQDACPSGKTIAMTLAVPPETAAEYATPGQYVQLRLDDETKPSFFAIASAPDPENAQFQFLVKRADSVEWLTALKAGAALQVSQVLGNGYAVADNLDGFKYDFPTQNVILTAAGSGIAPLAAVLNSNLLQLSENSRTCRLYYGEQTADDLCCVDQFQQWEEQGIEVVPVLSQPDDGWKGRVGYVQTALEEDGVPIPRNSGALVCGMKGMAEAVTELLKNAGVFEGRILFNF